MHENIFDKESMKGYTAEEERQHYNATIIHNYQ